MFFKRRKRDRKEAPIEEKDTEKEIKEELKEEPKEEPKEESKEEPKEEPKEVTEEKVMKTPEETKEEIELPTSDVMIREFLRTREAPFTIRMLTRETGLTLNDAKTGIQTLLSTEEIATHTVGKTPVYCKTSRFMAAIVSQVMPEGVPAFVQEENRRLIQENQKLNTQIVSFQTQLEKITALEQENKALSKKYKELQIKHTEIELKVVEPSEEQDPQLQERISALEQENKRLIQENQKLNAQIVSFQTQFGGKETEWKAVAMQMAEEMATRASASTEDVLRHFEAPGYY